MKPKQRLLAVRGLWNAFDPIGVFADGDGPADEYEGYCGPTLTLLMRGASVGKLAEFVRRATEDMGVSVDDPRIEAFAGRLRAWYLGALEG